MRANTHDRQYATETTSTPPLGDCSAHSTTSSLQSFPGPPLIHGCGRRSCTHHPNSIATISSTSVVSENRHGNASMRKTPQDSMHAYATCTHSMHSHKTTSQAAHAVQSKQCIVHRPACSCELPVSSGMLQLRGVSAHKRVFRPWTIRPDMVWKRPRYRNVRCSAYTYDGWSNGRRRRRREVEQRF